MHHQTSPSIIFLSSICLKKMDVTHASALHYVAPIIPKTVHLRKGMKAFRYCWCSHPKLWNQKVLIHGIRVGIIVGAVNFKGEALANVVDKTNESERVLLFWLWFDGGDELQ
jgi:hypothetical protein